jgi:hypothetical protein
VAIADPEILEAAQRLHPALWRRPLSGRLGDISDDTVNVLRYVPSIHVRDPGLHLLGVLEDALIRREYILALEELTLRLKQGAYLSLVTQASSVSLRAHHLTLTSQSRQLYFLFYVLLVRFDWWSTSRQLYKRQRRYLNNPLRSPFLSTLFALGLSPPLSCALVALIPFLYVKRLVVYTVGIYLACYKTHAATSLKDWGTHS